MKDCKICNGTGVKEIVDLEHGGFRESLCECQQRIHDAIRRFGDGSMLSDRLKGQVDRPLTRDQATTYLALLVKDVRELGMQLRDEPLTDAELDIVIEDLNDKISLLWAEVTK